MGTCIRQRLRPQKLSKVVLYYLFTKEMAGSSLFYCPRRSDASCFQGEQRELVPQIQAPDSSLSDGGNDFSLSKKMFELHYKSWPP